MDPATIVILLAIVGGWTSVKTGVRAVRSASSAASIPRSSRPSSKASRKSGGGMPGWLTRRRHTGTGWWAGEIGHGFPVLRGGLAEGWANHQTAMSQRQAAATKAKADSAHRQLTYRQEIDTHRKRIKDAQQKAAAAKAAKAAAATPPATPPASTGHTGKVGTMAPPSATCTDTSCWCHTKSTGQGGTPARPAPPPPPPGANGKPPAGGNSNTGGSKTMTDVTYENTVATFDKLTSLLEHILPDTDIGELTTLADALPAMLPDDSETVGHVSDAAAALQAMVAEQKKATEAIAAAKASHEKHNQASKEAADSQGGAPEREYVTNG